MLTLFRALARESGEGSGAPVSTNNSGGKRHGAGRPPGTANLKTREIADRAAAEGITPLEVILKAMRMKWEAGDFDGACAFAKDAAPYMHPRLAAIEARVESDVRQTLISAEPMSEEEWLAVYGAKDKPPTGESTLP
jgi:hypothetical protein